MRTVVKQRSSNGSDRFLLVVTITLTVFKLDEAGSLAPLANGFTMIMDAFAIGSISGGAFNPATAVGITAM